MYTQTIEFRRHHISYTSPVRKAGDERVTHFSDTLLISYGTKDPASFLSFLALKLIALSVSSLESGLLIRGAIVLDNMCHTDSVAVGPALVTAHEMESREAIYPRILIQDALTPRLSDEDKCRDSDGCWHLDIFKNVDDPGDFLPIRQGILKACEHQTNDRTIIQKRRWMISQFNARLAKVPHSGIDPIDLVNPI